MRRQQPINRKLLEIELRFRLFLLKISIFLRCACWSQKPAKLVNESLQLKVADAGSIPAGSTIVSQINKIHDSYSGMDDLSLPSIFFSIWHILMRVKSKISPISCRVFGPSFAAIKTQFIPVLHFIQFLQSFFLQATPNFSCCSKHVDFEFNIYSLEDFS